MTKLQVTWRIVYIAPDLPDTPHRTCGTGTSALLYVVIAKLVDGQWAVCQLSRKPKRHDEET